MGCSRVNEYLEDGPQYREGDDEQAMITLDYLHNEWEEFEPDDTDDDEFGEDDGPEPVSSTLKYFQSEDGNEAVLAGIGIFEDSRVAEESVEDYTNSNFVGEESVNLGDGGERGVFNETWALVAFFTRMSLSFQELSANLAWSFNQTTAGHIL